MEWHTLHNSPALPPLYVRAALKRGISGTTLPDSGLRCSVPINPTHVKAYREVCGFAQSPLLPATYPHILAFGLQLQLLTAKNFPFPLLGLVHLSNRIRVLRPLGALSDVQISVHAQNLQPHAKGATFDLITTLDDSLGRLWEGESRMLCRGVELAGDAIDHPLQVDEPLNELLRWQVPADIGRRYARVSGDYNPIHLSALTARLFGFPQAIAHGLWSKARTLAALDEHLPIVNIEIAVDFKKPLRLPGEAILSCSPPGSNGQWQLNGPGAIEHMLGQWKPIA